MYFVNFDQQSNRADWIDTIELRDDEDGQLIDLTGWTITMQVRTKTQSGQGSVPYVPFSIYGGLSPVVLTGSTTDGSITIPSIGIIQWTFRANAMSNLGPGFYEVGMILFKDPDTVQLAIGLVPIVEGVVC